MKRRRSQVQMLYWINYMYFRLFSLYLILSRLIILLHFEQMRAFFHILHIEKTIFKKNIRLLLTSKIVTSEFFLFKTDEIINYGLWNLRFFSSSSLPPPHHLLLIYTYHIYLFSFSSLCFLKLCWILTFFLFFLFGWYAGNKY